MNRLDGEDRFVAAVEVFLPGEFGVRSEIDIFIGEDGPRITTSVQREVVLIRG